MTENETKAVKFIQSIKDNAVVTLDHIAKEEPNVNPLLYKGRKEKANTILAMVGELLQYRAIGTVEECRTAVEIHKALYERKLMPRKIIEKKILPKYFDAVIRDRKKFEIRKDEDNLQIGDAVILKEWDGEKYTGRETGRNIVYILRDVPEYGLMPGYVIFGW